MNTLDQELKQSYVDLLETYPAYAPFFRWYASAAQASVANLNAAKETTDVYQFMLDRWATRSHAVMRVLPEGSEVHAGFLEHLAISSAFVAATMERLYDGDADDPDWILTPSSIVETASGALTSTDNPIQDVIGANKWSTASKNRPAKIERGDLIHLLPGEYHHFRNTHTYDENGTDPTTRIVAPDRATILANPVGGSQTHYVEWDGGWMFENLDFVGDDLAAEFSENPASARWDGSHPGFRDLTWINCTIQGNWNAETMPDKPDSASKWGILNYQMGKSATPSQPGWQWIGGTIEGIWTEHAAYFHNIQGDILFEDVKIRWCGRTAFQMANRVGEGPAGVGNLTFRDVEVEDVALQDGGGGSAFSFNGRHTGQILMERVKVFLGANPNLAAPRNKNITGALVIHAGGDTQDAPNGDVVVKDCHFQVGPAFAGEGSARRGNIQVRECRSFWLEGTTVHQLGDNPREALDIDSTVVVDKLYLDPSNDIVGECIFDGTSYATYAEMLENIAGHPKVVIL